MGAGPARAAGQGMGTALVGAGAAPASLRQTGFSLS